MKKTLTKFIDGAARGVGSGIGADKGRIMGDLFYDMCHGIKNYGFKRFFRNFFITFERK